MCVPIKEHAKKQNKLSKKQNLEEKRVKHFDVINKECAYCIDFKKKIKVL